MINLKTASALLIVAAAAFGASAAEAATTSRLTEGRNAYLSQTAENGAAAILQQETANARSSR